jgi:hypothetical protein
MTQFYEVQPDTFNLDTGQLLDPQGKEIQPQVPPDPYKEEIKQLKEKGVPLPKILKGIDGLGVENPEELKQFAESLYNVFNEEAEVDKKSDMV